MLSFSGKTIKLRKKTLKDDWLREIGKHAPVNLSLMQCHGDHVTNSGLRDMFRDCSDSLQVNNE